MSNNSHSSTLFIIALLIVVANGTTSIYRARGDGRELAFMVTLYASLIGFIACMEIRRRREGKGVMIKIAVLGFSTMILGTFAWGFALGLKIGVVGQIVFPLVVAFVAFGLLLAK